jgi:hypothetical protein
MSLARNFHRAKRIAVGVFIGSMFSTGWLIVRLYSEHPSGVDPMSRTVLFPLALGLGLLLALVGTHVASRFGWRSGIATMDYFAGMLFGLGALGFVLQFESAQVLVPILSLIAGCGALATGRQRDAT